MKNKIIKIVFLLAGLLCFIWFLIPYVTKDVLNIGNITGMLVSLAIIIYIFFIRQINCLVKRIWKKTLGKIILSLLGCICAFVIIATVIITFLMISAAHKEPTEDDTLIVLGCRVYGENASLMLIERMDAAYDYLLKNEDAVCIVSGGQGEGEDISEAECMYRYLTNKGIESDRIYVEDKSTSTRENLLFSKEIIEENDLSANVAIVTNEFHEYRALKVSKSIGMNASAIPASTAWWLLPTFYVRELYAVVSYEIS